MKSGVSPVLRTQRALWKQQEGQHGKPETSESVGFCQEHLETPLMSSARCPHTFLLPTFLSPLLNALLIYVTVIHSTPLPYFTFYYPLHDFIQVYILHYVLCCHFSYFIFDFDFNSAPGSCVATVSLSSFALPEPRCFTAYCLLTPEFWDAMPCMYG